MKFNEKSKKCKSIKEMFKQILQKNAGWNEKN